MKQWLTILSGLCLLGGAVRAQTRWAVLVKAGEDTTWWQGSASPHALVLPAPGATMFREEAAETFRIIDFHVRSLSNTGAGRCFLRFYDSAGRLISEETIELPGKNAFAFTGIYTECPPRTARVRAGVQTAGPAPVTIDSISFVSLSGLSRRPAAAALSLPALLRSFRRGDTVFDEAVLMYAAPGRRGTGRLLYRPDKILRVTSFSGDRLFAEGTDFTRTGNRLSVVPYSPVPVVSAHFFDTKADLAWYDLQSKWIRVTYVHHDRWTAPVTRFAGEQLPQTMRRLTTGSPLRVVAYGMSITRGLNTSGYDSVPPYQPSYIDCWTGMLRTHFKTGGLLLFNAALPGATVEWGAANAGRLVNPLSPHLVVIDFGMNDFWRLTPVAFGHQLRNLIDTIKGNNPHAEFLLIANMTFDPLYVLDTDKNKGFYLSNMAGYAPVIRSFEGPGIAVLDMTTLSREIYRRKSARDCLSNPLHPNDYMARWYAQELTDMFIR